MSNKIMKWSFVLAVVGGLSSCMMYDQRSEQVPPSPMVYTQQQPVQQTKVVKVPKAAGTSAATTSAKEPMQKSTPGPKRAAAPQIPVIE